MSFIQFVIVLVASLASLFLIVFGTVSDERWILVTGLSILSALLAAANIKYQPVISKAKKSLEATGASWWNRFLKWIARTYFSFYCHFLQREPDDPITRQADRINRRWPTITTGAALIIFNRVALLHGWLWILIIAVNLFALWFIPHINQYALSHPDNVPYRLPLRRRLLRWSQKTMGIELVRS